MQYGDSLSQKIYFALPYAGKIAAATYYGWRQRNDRYGAFFKSGLADLIERERWSNDLLREECEARALAFVNESIQKSPYYANAEGYQPCSTYDDVTSLPILDKDEVRRFQNEIVRPDVKPFKVVHTSGTTGKSLVFPVDHLSFQREYAFRALHYRWGGVSGHEQEPVVFVSGHPVAFYDRRRPPYWVYDLANNWLLMSSYHLNETNLKSYVAEIKRFRPVMISGYPSSLYLLALSWQGSADSIKAVYTTSETLFPFQREVIESAFGAKVFNWYGNTELCGNIVECEFGELHLKYEHSSLEVIKDDGEHASPGESGRLICTGFGNSVFPLIRYDVGDRVTISREQRCECGRGGLLIDSVEGRKEDYVVTADGRKIGRLDHLFKDSQNVREAQIVQRRPGEVSIRVVPRSGYDASDEKIILDGARLRLGSDTSIDLSLVEEIERTSNGKFRFIVSEIAENRVDQTPFVLANETQ